MKPALPVVLNNVAALLADAAAAGEDTQLAADLPFMRAVVTVTAKEYEQGAARRVREIGALTALLAKGAGLPGCPVPAPEPPGSLLDADLRISALEARIDALLAQLIELQVWLEEQAGEDAAALRREAARHLYETARANAAVLSTR
jgi:hypothetical protein